MDLKTIAVCGATGQQGGATVDALLKSASWRIMAFSREPDGAKSKALKERGVTVVKADLQDKSSLVNAFQGVEMVFGVTQPFATGSRKPSSSREKLQGFNIVDACVESGVKHLVLSSVLSLEMKMSASVEHVDAKGAIVDYLKSSGLSYTILRPSAFMDTIGTSFFPVKRSSVRGFTDSDAKIPYISTKNIGEFAAIVFRDPASYRQRELGLIADHVSGEELASIIGRVRGGERYKYAAIPRLIMRLLSGEFYKMRKAFETLGRPPYPKEIAANIKQCREIYPDMMTLEDYLRFRKFDTKAL